MRRALLVIDVLNDFAEKGAPLFVPALWRAMPEIKNRIIAARSYGEPVIFVCDSHAPDDPEFFVWPPHALRGSEGARIVDELEPVAGDEIVAKTTLSSFHGTSLDPLLRELEINTVRLTGCVTEICVLYAAYEAVIRGLHVEVVSAGVAGLDESDHERALGHMKKVLGARLI